MAASEIEHREKRLVFFLSIFPVSFSAGQIPDFRARRILELIVGLTVVGAVIASLFEIHGEWLQPVRQFGIATHVMGANAVLVHAGDDRRAAGGTHASGSECI